MSPKPMDNSSDSNHYVAVVDDDLSVCRLFSRLLAAAGFHPVSYPSAEAFLVDDGRPQFDCLVLDIQLEGMSGLELNHRLAAVKDRTPVIFTAANTTRRPGLTQEEATPTAGLVGHDITKTTQQKNRNEDRNWFTDGY